MHGLNSRAPAAASLEANPLGHCPLGLQAQGSLLSSPGQATFRLPILLDMETSFSSHKLL